MERSRYDAVGVGRGGSGWSPRWRGGPARPGGGERYSVARVGVGATTPALISRDEAGARLSRCAGGPGAGARRACWAPSLCPLPDFARVFLWLGQGTGVGMEGLMGFLELGRLWGRRLPGPDLARVHLQRDRRHCLAPDC